MSGLWERIRGNKRGLVTALSEAEEDGHLRSCLLRCSRRNKERTQVKIRPTAPSLDVRCPLTAANLLIEECWKTVPPALGKGSGGETASTFDPSPVGSRAALGTARGRTARPAAPAFTHQLQGQQIIPGKCQGRVQQDGIPAGEHAGGAGLALPCQDKSKWESSWPREPGSSCPAATLQLNWGRKVFSNATFFYAFDHRFGHTSSGGGVNPSQTAPRTVSSSAYGWPEVL